MTLTSVKLMSGQREMALLGRTDLKLQKLDVPMPAVRAVTEERVDDDGERDTTDYFGATSCTVELLAITSPAAVKDELAIFLHPRSRPYLVVTDDEWTTSRRLMLRTDQASWPLEAKVAPLRRAIQVQWRVPDGIWEDEDLTSETINADITSTVGLEFQITFPITFDVTTASGVTIVSNDGKIPAHWTGKLYGPCVGPQLTNETTGETIAFSGGDTGLTIAAGDYVEISSRDRSAYLLSDTSASRLNYIDFDVTSWWRLEPGDNQVRYHPASGVGAGSAAVLEFRQSYL